MKNKIRVVSFFLAGLAFVALRPILAAEKSGEWVRIPGNWLIHRFVRPATAPAHTYRVALVVPPGGSAAKVAQSSGNSAVDGVAGDFALESIRKNGTLKNLGASKELYFQFVITPPALDIKMRTKEGQRPAPPGKDWYTPTSGTFFLNPNQEETTTRGGELIVIFPPQGGYASEAIVTVTTGNPAVDRYYLHSAALNWQTTRKSSTNQVYHSTYNVRKPTHQESIFDQ
ncbi:MAG TPA: hypothetical protein VK581_04165 [Chthoniobacterales bacterium]|nr:hypothetical protein [Chthoniobacterales bacterium]